MKRVVFLLVLLLLSTFSAFGQYASSEPVDYSQTREYKLAKTAYYSGIAVFCVGAASWVTGSIMTTVEMNRYTNNHLTTGTAEEIIALNNEAKQQPEYKRAATIQTVGFVATVAGIGVSLLGKRKIKKIENAAGETVTALGYGFTGSGIQLALSF